MSGDLTTSAVARQNILNNPYAVGEVEKVTGIRGIPFEGTFVVLKEQVADFFEVGLRTIETITADNLDELSKNGYAVIKGNRLKLFKNSLNEDDVPAEIRGNIKRAPQLAIFPFRAFLNLAMLLPGSDRARSLRQVILDVAIDTVNQRAGGSTKYVNQRDEDYLVATFAGEGYRKEFTDALKDCVNMGNFKYAVYTDRVYQSIFLEKSKEYRNILKLEKSDKTRSTFYAEVLDLIASLEHAVTEALRAKSNELGRMLTGTETNAVFDAVSSMAVYTPLFERARAKMASRDYYYPTVADKLAYLFFGLSTGHCFADGNKRIAITATVQMLLNNGYFAIVKRFMVEMENITVHVATGVISRDLLRDIISCHLNLDPDNEEIKLRLYECISNAIPPEGQ